MRHSKLLRAFSGTLSGQHDDPKQFTCTIQKLMGVNCHWHTLRMVPQEMPLHLTINSIYSIHGQATCLASSWTPPPKDVDKLSMQLTVQRVQGRKTWTFRSCNNTFYIKKKKKKEPMISHTQKEKQAMYILPSTYWSVSVSSYFKAQVFHRVNEEKTGVRKVINIGIHRMRGDWLWSCAFIDHFYVCGRIAW